MGLRQDISTTAVLGARERSAGYAKRKKSILSREILGNRDELMSKISPQGFRESDTIKSSMDKNQMYEMNKKKRTNLGAIPGLIN